jgi:hypothetical protein
MDDFRSFLRHKYDNHAMKAKLEEKDKEGYQRALLWSRIDLQLTAQEFDWQD